MTDPANPVPGGRELQLWRDLLASERDAVALYEGLAAAATGERAEVLAELAGVERRHAAHWEGRLRAAGAAVPAVGAPAPGTRVLLGLARRAGVERVLPWVERAERRSAGTYDGVDAAAPGMAADEREHARRLRGLRGTSPSAGERHRVDRSGALRAAVFGVSDGLVSNTALVMGFAGSGASRSTVLLAGIAGLLSGSFSMAAGEYVSMAGQREMYEREIALERTEIAETPEDEHRELVLLYRAKGLSTEEATVIADRVMADPEVALDTMAREELGLDPDELGSPWAAAASSLWAFAAGALVVVLPYLVTGGTAALVTAVVLALLGMTTVGAGLGLTNGRSVLRSVVRQVAVGSAAAAVTFAVGSLVGTAVG